MADIIQLLKSTRIFSSLSEETLKRLVPKFIEVTLDKDDQLFLQGDPSDSVYLLISGKLAARLPSITNETRFIGYIEAGETVGELGALSNEPRSLTVNALKDSVLLKIPAQDFIELCHEYPSILFATLHPIIERSKNLIQMLSPERKKNHIVIVPSNSAISIEKFAEKILNYAQTFKSLTVISDYSPIFKDKNETIESVNKKIQELTQNKKPSKYIYLLRSFDTPVARVAFKEIDTLYIAAEASSTPKIDKHILDKMASKRINMQHDPSLILIHPEGTRVPVNTSAWLQQANFHLHHHVRLDNLKDIQRTVRFLRGKAVGVVLSGGGTRGWGHLGAIKAIKEAKIPIDMIGGTSCGAVVGACYGLQLSFEEAFSRFYKIVMSSKNTISWRGLTWPAISLFSSKNYTSALMEAFGDELIEDMWLPYFCVSTNLATANETVHTSGLLWEKNRASSSIPGIIPPMLINGEMHLDGGLLNNLPVDIMRQFVGNKAKIIAVELNSYMPRHHNYHFPPILTFKNALYSKLGIGKHKYKIPRFVDTFLRGLFVGSVLKTKQNALAANVFVSLNLGKYRLLHVNPEQADDLVEIGFKETLKQIYELKNRVE